MEEENKELNENIENNTPEEKSVWEEVNQDNAVVKKYIIYISKDFIPLMDSLDTDKRSAYINDAIQKKIDSEDTRKIQNKKIRLLIHFIIMIVIVLSLTPALLLFANKAIMATFENYKYSQDNFEKLYRSHFGKSNAYMRSVNYNKKHNIK